MAMDRQADYFSLHTPEARIITNQPSSAADAPADEVMAEADEPPDDSHAATPKMSTMKPIISQPEPADFTKKVCALQRKQSLLTQMIHTSESDSHSEDENLFSDAKRALSTTSTWSIASTADLTSDGHTSPVRTGSPSPPLPLARSNTLPPVFNTRSFSGTASNKVKHTPGVDPLQKPPVLASEQAVEAGLGRKRCIAFACGGRKEEPRKPDLAEVENARPSAPDKRPSALRFICTTKDSAPAPNPVARPARLVSPPPERRLPISPKGQQRQHRGSDSTVRNDSPKSVRKLPPVIRTRRGSEDMEVERYEATRFHEFASSDEEVDDWIQESTCHKRRITVDDTLSVEKNLRKIADEAEAEAMEEEEEEEAEEDVENLLEVDDASDDDAKEDYVSDEGFQTDDEEGFAGSDDESDAGSDYAWWAPGLGNSVEHIRPTGRRTDSASSIGSYSSAHEYSAVSARLSTRPRRSPAMKTERPLTPELPDSTDFVCGTLDEDRPLELAYLTQLEKRRAAKRLAVPQDIDPTFPTSDPDMEEEDEASGHDVVDESDHHPMVHGAMEPHDDTDMDERQPRRLIPRKRSPPHSPGKHRLRSPPPAKRTQRKSPPPTKRGIHRSPPPRKLFSQSPRHAKSSPPAGRPLRSPPPTRRTSFTRPSNQATGLASRPQLGMASSLPRNGHECIRPSLHSEADDDDNEQTQTDALPTRTAIDIVKGLEKKRQRRNEKLLEKHCRNKGKKPEKALLPGKGAEKMREMGLGLAAYRGKRPAQIWPAGPLLPSPDGKDAVHILSY